ncbi:hypothetical protein IH824_03025 [candidate division KSB1 bacterium]|nr:hypothetical protein [candidate division KSB1 bacterium]
MITQIIIKFSFFVAILGILYCLVIGVSFSESILRGLFVFAGIYLVLIVFFVGVRVIMTQGPKKVEPKAVKPKTVEQPEEAAEEEIAGE